MINERGRHIPGSTVVGLLPLCGAQWSGKVPEFEDGHRDHVVPGVRMRADRQDPIAATQASAMADACARTLKPF